MKHLFKTLAAGVFAALTAFAQPALAKDLVIATDADFVPFEFKEGTKYVGFDIDILDAVAKEVGITYKLQPMDFNGIIPGLISKNLDGAIAGMTIKEERKKAVDFSDGYYDAGFIVMVPEGNTTIKGPQDLAGKKVAMKTGTAAVDWLKANVKDVEIILFPNIGLAYLELQSGRVDAAMHDTPNVLYYAMTQGKGKVKAVGQQVEAAPYGIAFPKGSDIVPKVNEALKKIKADGRYAAIYKKWFGTEPTK